MPDPDRQTISATQASALFNANPYITKWMLYHYFASGMDLPKEENSRMKWGTLMEPLVLAEAAEHMRMEVLPNENRYQRRGLLGCTRDALIVAPDRGPGALETKCVFDYRQWKEKWGGGDYIPPEVEIQLQTQMLVGDTFHGSYGWGLLAVWVCGDMFYFDREANEPMWRDLVKHAEGFFDDVAALREPDPLGRVIELPWLAALYPRTEGKILDLRDVEGAEMYVQKAATFIAAREAKNVNEKNAEGYRAEFMGLARGAEKILLPGGGNIQIGKRNVVTAWLPKGGGDGE